MEIIKCLEKSDIVTDFNLLDLKIFEGGFYIKIKAILINDTELHIREYSDANERNYSYHWQTKKNNLIMRWDNAPHHKNLDSHPHHTHIENKVQPNYDISCSDILKLIKKRL